MKTNKTIILISLLFLVTACIPDSFTNWNLAPPSSGSSGSSGVVPPPTGTVPEAPTSVIYTPGGPYQFNRTSGNDTGVIPNLTPVSTGGGEIVEGYVTFELATVLNTSRNSSTPIMPDSLTLDSATGVISGKANQFLNNFTYNIKVSPQGGSPFITSINISMATRPGTIFYPQTNGQTLLLQVDNPQNFKAGDSVTSQKNARGKVTSVDTTNKIVYIDVACSTFTTFPTTPAPCPYVVPTPQGNNPPPQFCPNFETGDNIDNKDGYFLSLATISGVVYGFNKNTNGIAANKMVPMTNPYLCNEMPVYAITPALPSSGTSLTFNSATGEIKGNPANALPNTKFIVTVKNILGQTANANLNIQILDVSNPKSPETLEYAYKSGERVVLNVGDTSSFLVGGRVSNKNGTVATVRGITSTSDLLVDINVGSVSAFQPNQALDNGYPYILSVTTTTAFQPILVHELGKMFQFKPTVTPTFPQADLDTFTWTSTPELPHLCQSITSTPTLYFPENNELDCLNFNGTCSIVVSPNTESTCEAASPTAGTWTTSAKFLTEYKDELWFNRRTGEFGADNPKKTFSSQVFDVSATSLTAVTVNTKTAISFEGIPKNLGYASDVLLEVDDFTDFEIGDMITSNGTGVGVITHKFKATPPSTPTYPSSENVLVVRATSGVFLDEEDIDNVYPFTYQKGEIIKAKYSNLGVQINPNIPFQTGEEVIMVANGTTEPILAKGIINFIENTSVASNTENVLWIRKIDNINFPSNFTTSGPPDIRSSTALSPIIGIIGDNITITTNGGNIFAAGMDVSSYASGTTGGFAMVNGVSGDNVSVSVAQGMFVKDGATPVDLYRFNPPNSTATGQAWAGIFDITHNMVFFLDRFSTSGIQPVIDSPANNGVSFSIKPNLPTGLSFDTATGQITTVPPGPVASILKNYTVIASNFLGQTSFTFGLGVREVFSISDITNTDGNMSAILHKSGEGYSRFPCRVTQDQIKAKSSTSGDQYPSRAKNINCLYDIGEGELYSNGLTLQVNVGTNLCTYVEHVPYFFYQQQYLQTDPLTTPRNMEHTGDWSNVMCGPGQPGGTPIQYPDQDPASQCIGNQGGVQCDDGQVPTIQRNYNMFDVCYNSGGTPVAGVTDLETCFGNPNGTNRASCSDGSTDNRATCLGNNFAWNSTHAFINNQCWLIQTSATDQTSCAESFGSCSVAVPGCAVNANGCTTRSICTDNSGNWSSTGRWVSNAACQSTAGVNGPNYDCGGEQLNCINGPAKSFSNFPESGMTDRFGNYLRGAIIPVNTTAITFPYPSPESLGYQTNIYLSNFSQLNSCGTDTGNEYEYEMSTWTNVGRNHDPTVDGTNQPFSGGNGVYTIRCLDAAFNVRAQINLLVREWDKDFKAVDGTDRMTIVGNTMDAPPPAIDPDFGDPADAYYDWDDYSRGVFTTPSQPDLTGSSTCATPTYYYPGSNL